MIDCGIGSVWMAIDSSSSLIIFPDGFLHTQFQWLYQLDCELELGLCYSGGLRLLNQLEYIQGPLIFTQQLWKLVFKMKVHSIRRFK